MMALLHMAGLENSECMRGARYLYLNVAVEKRNISGV